MTNLGCWAQGSEHRAVAMSCFRCTELDLPSLATQKVTCNAKHCWTFIKAKQLSQCICKVVWACEAFHFQISLALLQMGHGLVSFFASPCASLSLNKNQFNKLDQISPCAQRRSSPRLALTIEMEVNSKLHSIILAGGTSFKCKVASNY